MKYYAFLAHKARIRSNMNIRSNRDFSREKTEIIDSDIFPYVYFLR